MKGISIHIEGIDGAGKGVVVNRCEKFFLDKGVEVVMVREPGSTKLGEALRSVLLNKETGVISDMAEILLFFAARAQIYNELVMPALKEGKVVISDRGVYSSYTYQQARGMSYLTINALDHIVTGGFRPDLAILLDLPAEVGLKRAGRNGGHDRIEETGVLFFEKVRQNYLELAKRDPARIKIVNALQGIEDVSKDVERILAHNLTRRVESLLQKKDRNAS